MRICWISNANPKQPFEYLDIKNFLSRVVAKTLTLIEPEITFTADSTASGLPQLSWLAAFNQISDPIFNGSGALDRSDESHRDRNKAELSELAAAIRQKQPCRCMHKIEFPCALFWM